MEEKIFVGRVKSLKRKCEMESEKKVKANLKVRGGSDKAASLEFLATIAKHVSDDSCRRRLQAVGGVVLIIAGEAC